MHLIHLHYYFFISIYPGNICTSIYCFNSLDISADYSALNSRLSTLKQLDLLRSQIYDTLGKTSGNATCVQLLWPGPLLWDLETHHFILCFRRRRRVVSSLIVSSKSVDIDTAKHIANIPGRITPKSRNNRIFTKKHATAFRNFYAKNNSLTSSSILACSCECSRCILHGTVVSSSTQAHRLFLLLK